MSYEYYRLKRNRDYFEVGCLCIGKTISLLPENIHNKDAVKYYEDNCRCSRNYTTGKYCK